MALTTSPNLLVVPPELRNIIYHEVATAVPVVMANINCDTPDDISAALRVDQSLSKVCRQLREEAGPVVTTIAPLTAPKLIVRMDAFHFEKLSRLSDYLQVQAESCKLGISEPKSMTIVLRLGRETQDSLMSTQRQLEAHIRDASVRASPFRYSRLFRLTHLECGFHLHTEFTPTTETWKSTAHERVAFTEYFWVLLEDQLFSQGAEVHAAVVPELYHEGLREAYWAFRAARAPRLLTIEI